ncbi:MAG TPA: hypothetical protein VF844_02705 [Ktedonobacteraceae bacterium]
MRTVQIDRRRSRWLIISLATALVFVLTACGANSGSGTSTGSTPPPTSTSAVNPHGCPSNAVIGTAPTPANVVLKPSNSSTTINAHQGDVIEIQLPFGQLWNGPTTSQGVLQLETPAGYAWGATNSCVWRFTAQGAGVTQLNFYGKARCKKGEMCPQYIMSVPFTINVK